MDEPKRIEHDPNNMVTMLERASARVKPATIIDVGASDGRWMDIARRFWPASSGLLIEADERHWQWLDQYAAAHGYHTAHAMAGERPGVGHFAFSPTDPWGGQGSDAPRADTREIVCVSVGDEVKTRQLAGPYLLKLDTHGFERQVLNGAWQILDECCAIVVEAYTCVLQRGALTFWELCEFLGARGFSPTDIADVMRRPLDGRWWQMDMLFERSSAEMVGLPRYR